MQCVNKFLLSPIPIPFNNSPNSSTKSLILQPRNRKQQIYHNSKGRILAKKTVFFPSDVKTITSTSNPFVKHCVKLRQSSSYRHLHGLVLVVGTTPVREIYSFQKESADRPLIECLLVLEDDHGITDNAAHIIRVSSEVIRKISGVLSADSVEIIGLVRIPSTFHIVRDNLHQKDCGALFSFPRRILVLDGIQDPGNVGTLIRSAKAFKWDGVFLLPGCCDPFNDKALRASRGACFQIPIVSGNWSDVETVREEFKMKMVAGHPARSDNQNQVMKLSKDFACSVADLPLCLVLGSEGGGLSEYSREACELVTIPMAGEFESLNVSVAGGIFMYQLQNAE